MVWPRKRFFLVSLLATVAGAGLAQQAVISFDEAPWNLDNARGVEHLGRRARLGMAVLKDVGFGNGVTAG